MEKELSPAAKAVMDAYEAAPIVGVYPLYADQLAVAAALRAVAAQVAEEQPEPNWGTAEIGDFVAAETQNRIRSQLIGIADELDGGANTSQEHLEAEE